MHAPYRPLPDKDGTIHLLPFIRVRAAKRRGEKSRYFEALVDSGAADRLFHSAVAEVIGLELEAGKKEQRSGIGGVQDVWIHPIELYVGSEVLNIQAAFARSLPVAGLLGRKGFFEHFKITFDPTSEPPGLTLDRVYKS